MSTSKKISALAILSAVILLGACAETRTQESTGQYVNNSMLTAKVKTALFNDPSIKSTEITVETFKNEVQLSGFVSSIDEAKKAVDIASKVQGVSSVKNDMRVKGTNNPFYK